IMKHELKYEKNKFKLCSRVETSQAPNKLTSSDGSPVSWDGSDGPDGGLNGNSLGDDGRGRAVNNGVESVDGISGVGDGTDGTIGLDKGVLSADKISVPGLGGGLGVSGQGVRDRVSVVVL